VVPPAVALVLGIGALTVGAVVLAGGGVIAGIIWLTAGVALVVLVLVASRRWPASALPSLAGRLADGAGRRVGLAKVTAGQWGIASRRVVALRREVRSLRTERDAQLLALGEAAYRDQAEEIRALKGQIGEIDARIEADELEIEEVLEKAHERVRKEKVAVRPTEQFAVAESPPPLADDEKTRTAPTAARRRPSPSQSA
jgi:hypothetical protein